MIRYLPLTAILVGIVFGVFRFYKLDRIQKLLLLHLLVAFVVELAAAQMAIEGNSNLWLLHYYVNEEYLIFALCFYWGFENSILAKYILYSIPFFIGFSLINSVFIQDLNSFNSFARGLESLLLIVFSILFLIQNNGSQELEKIRPMHIVSCALLLYFSAGIITFFSVNFLIEKIGAYAVNLLWTVHLYLCMIYYLIYTFSFWNYRRIQKY